MMQSARIVDMDAAALVGVRVIAQVGQVRSNHLADFTVVVEEDHCRALAIEVFEAPDEYHFRREAIVWGDWIVVGFGQRVELVGMSGSSARRVTISLDGYFGYLSTAQAQAGDLLVASARSVRCIASDGSTRWVSESLAVDGVILREVVDGRVQGDGEMDPPGGWRPFQLSLANGARLR